MIPVVSVSGTASRRPGWNQGAQSECCSSYSRDRCGLSQGAEVEVFGKFNSEYILEGKTEMIFDALDEG